MRAGERVSVPGKSGGFREEQPSSSVLPSADKIFASARHGWRLPPPLPHLNWFQTPPEARRGAGERRGGRRRCAGPRCSPRPPPPRVAPLPALLATPAGRRSRGWHRHGNLREKERKPVSSPLLSYSPAPRGGGGTVPRRGAGCGPAGVVVVGSRGRTSPRLRA